MRGYARRIVGLPSGPIEPLLVVESVLPGLAERISDCSDGLYVAFEDVFYDPDRVRPMMERYLPLLKERAALGQVVDIGAGRGEFLDMMLAAGIDAVGCEINTAEYEVLVERGLPVTLADAREFLSAFKPESLAAVTAVQVVEHLQADYLVELLTSIGSKLAPGGVVVLETPNMLNWLVHQNFWLDISHVRPYPPATLQFYLREAGCGDSNSGTRPVPASRWSCQRACVQLWECRVDRLQVNSIRPRESRTGINLFGHLSSFIGLGEAARSTADLIASCGLRFVCVEPDLGDRSRQTHFDCVRVTNLAELPYSTSVYHLNPPEFLGSIVRWRSNTGFEMEPTLNVMVPFWELPVLPEMWIQVLLSMDMVLAPSRYIAEVLEGALPEAAASHVVHFPQAVSPPQTVNPNRVRWLGIARTALRRSSRSTPRAILRGRILPP